MRVGVPAAPLVTLPAPASEPSVSDKPLISKVAPLAMVIALLLEILSAAVERVNVPALIVVAPV